MVIKLQGFETIQTFGGSHLFKVLRGHLAVVARELYPIVKIRQMRYSAQIKDHENLHYVSILLG